MPAALVPRPWDFPDQPKLSIGQPGNSPTTLPGPLPSPQPPTQAQPEQPTLSPPLPLPSHLPVTSAPNSAPPVDNTPVEVASLEDSVPDVKVIPPNPPATVTLRGKPEGINALDTDVAVSAAPAAVVGAAAAA